MLKSPIFASLLVVCCSPSLNLTGGSPTKKAAVAKADSDDPSADANSGNPSADANSGNPLGGLNNPTDGSTPAERAATAKAIQSLMKVCSSGVKKSRSIEVQFPSNTGAVCPFGKGDNLDKNNGKITARIEKDFPLDIPKSHKVCSMMADAPKQPMRYDDHLFLALNGTVLLSSTTEAERFLTGSNGFKRYDWTKIKGQESADPPSYCGPGLTCKLPRTQVEGDFSFSISDAASPKIFAPLLGSDLKFQLILTGDDNPESDCQLNTPLKVNVRYEYVE